MYIYIDLYIYIFKLARPCVKVLYKRDLGVHGLGKSGPLSLGGAVTLRMDNYCGSLQLAGQWAASIYDLHAAEFRPRLYRVPSIAQGQEGGTLELAERMSASVSNLRIRLCRFFVNSGIELIRTQAATPM